MLVIFTVLSMLEDIRSSFVSIFPFQAKQQCYTKSQKYNGTSKTSRASNLPSTRHNTFYDNQEQFSCYGILCKHKLPWLLNVNVYIFIICTIFLNPFLTFYLLYFTSYCCSCTVSYTLFYHISCVHCPLCCRSAVNSPIVGLIRENLIL